MLYYQRDIIATQQRTVIAPDQFVRDTKGFQVIGRQLVAGRRARKEFRRIVMHSFRLAQIAEADEGGVICSSTTTGRSAKDAAPVLAARLVVAHIARIQVQIAQDAHEEFIVVVVVVVGERPTCRCSCSGCLFCSSSSVGGYLYLMMRSSSEGTTRKGWSCSRKEEPQCGG